MSPPRPQKRTLFKKVRSSLRYIKRDNLSLQLQAFVILLVLHGLFGTNMVSGFYGWPSRKALREKLQSDHIDELAVFLNSKATKEEIRIAGIKLGIAH